MTVGGLAPGVVVVDDRATGAEKTRQLEAQRVAVQALVDVSNLQNVSPGSPYWQTAAGQAALLRLQQSGAVQPTTPVSQGTGAVMQGGGGPTQLGQVPAGMVQATPQYQAALNQALVGVGMAPLSGFGQSARIRVQEQIISQMPPGDAA